MPTVYKTTNDESTLVLFSGLGIGASAGTKKLAISNIKIVPTMGTEIVVSVFVQANDPGNSTTRKAYILRRAIIPIGTYIDLGSYNTTNQYDVIVTLENKGGVTVHMDYIETIDEQYVSDYDTLNHT